MKTILNKLYLLALFIGCFASCKPEKDLPIPKADKGSLDLTSYVAIGNSLTSGFQDGGLFYEGQKSSYAAVLAQQFKTVQSDLVFNTPFVQANSVGIGQPAATLDASNFLSPILIVKVPAPVSLQTKYNLCTGKNSLIPFAISRYGDGKALLGADSLTISLTNSAGGGGLLPPSIYNSGNGTAPAGPYQNMGVPGARVIDINRKGFGGKYLIQSVNIATQVVVQSNPFFSRFAKNQATSSILSDAMIMKPTFFSLFIGNNDVLLYAAGGGVTGNGAATATPLKEFSDSLDVVVNTLMKTAKQGVIINVPQIVGTPYFTFLPPNTSYKMIDEKGAVRKMRADDLVLLTVPNDSFNCNLGGFGTKIPIPKKYTLTASQAAMVTSLIDGYNAKLKAVADAKGLAFFDMDAFTKANAGGTQYNGMGVSGTFVTGGIFSLDGLHLTPRGYASLANEIIKVINAKYGSTIPGPDITNYNGVIFPK